MEAVNKYYHTHDRKSDAGTPLLFAQSWYQKNYVDTPLFLRQVKAGVVKTQRVMVGGAYVKLTSLRKSLFDPFLPTSLLVFVHIENYLTVLFAGFTYSTLRKTLFFTKILV